MRLRDLILLIVGIVAIAICFVAAAYIAAPARGQDLMDRGAWFKSLKQPNTGMSCCDISDCRRTDADFRDGQWWAVVENNWTPIPKEKELDKTSIDGEAYVCAGPRGTIYCFVKPNLAM